jgi:hypothetical protein
MNDVLSQITIDLQTTFNTDLQHVLHVGIRCARLVAACNRLTSLSLDGANLTDALFIALATNLHNLEVLSLSFCEQFTDLGVEHVKRCNRLQVR